MAALIPIAPAMAQDTSPYVVGHWRLNDTFTETNVSTSVHTDNTDFVFLNPTDLTLTLEYAFFGPDGEFCGCDRDTLSPNGRTRYTMAGELAGGQFTPNKCGNPTEGELKSIVFISEDKDKDGIIVGDALQAGIQIHITGDERSESNLQGVTINRTTLREMNEIHEQCEKVGA